MNDLKNINLNLFVIQELLHIFVVRIIINLNQEKCQSKKSV